LTQPTHTNQLAIVVATMDRPTQLRSVLTSIDGQSVSPQQVIVVDGGAESVAGIIEDFPSLNIDYVSLHPPGLTKQKNAGVSAVRSEIDLIGFVDDDMVFEDGAMEAMLDFWEAAPPEMGGASFNLPDFENKMSWLKSMPQRLFFIDNRKFGQVHRSGFNTPICNAADDTLVQWLGGGYTVWRKQVFERWHFDEWFAGSGVWEDVRFSHQVGREYSLSVVAGAKAAHVDAPVTIDRQIRLGKTQIVNWMYFVNSDPDLSTLMCTWACLGRTATNLTNGVVRLDRGYLLRGLGNILGLLSSGLGAAGSRRGDRVSHTQPRP
jgi:glycosyltransferase involved in cell wall biosynthesis